MQNNLIPCLMESGWLISNNYNIKFLILNIDNSKLYTGISNFDNLFQGNGTFFLSSQRHEGTTIFEEYLQRAQCGSWYRRIYNPWSWLLGKMGKEWGLTVECYTDCDVSTWTKYRNKLSFVSQAESFKKGDRFVIYFLFNCERCKGE